MNAGQRATRGRSEVRLEDGTTEPVRVDARPLAEGVLQLLDQRADTVGGADRRVRLVPDHQHDPGAAHLGDLGGHRAQPAGARWVTGASTRGERGSASHDQWARRASARRDHRAPQVRVHRDLRVSDREALNEDQIQRVTRRVEYDADVGDASDLAVLAARRSRAYVRCRPLLWYCRRRSRPSPRWSLQTPATQRQRSGGAHHERGDRRSPSAGRPTTRSRRASGTTGRSRATCGRDDRVCWSTVAGLSLIHVASVVGVIWIVVNPSAATLVLAASLYVAVRPVDHRRLPPPVRPPHVPRLAARPVGHAGVRRGDVPELGAVVERRPPRPPRRHRWRRRPPCHHAGVWFAHVGWLFRRASGVRRRHAAWATCGRCAASACSTAGTRSWRSASGSCSRWRSPRRGATRGAGSSSPASSAPASCCRRRSAINSLAHLVGTPRYDAALVGTRQHAHGARHLRRGLPQLPPPLPVRLPQRRPLVALRPEQVADLDDGPACGWSTRCDPRRHAPSPAPLDHERRNAPRAAADGRSCTRARPSTSEGGRRRARWPTRAFRRRRAPNPTPQRRYRRRAAPPPDVDGPTSLSTGACGLRSRTSSRSRSSLCRASIVQPASVWTMAFVTSSESTSTASSPVRQPRSESHVPTARRASPTEAWS